MTEKTYRICPLCNGSDRSAALQRNDAKSQQQTTMSAALAASELKLDFDFHRSARVSKTLRGQKALQMLVEGFDVFGAHIQYWRKLAILAAAVAIVIFCSGAIGLGHSRWRDRPFGEIDRSDHQFRPATAISGTPCFHLSQWATTSLMKGADAAHRLLMAGTKPPDPPSGPQPHRECQADSPG